MNFREVGWDNQKFKSRAIRDFFSFFLSCDCHEKTKSYNHKISKQTLNLLRPVGGLQTWRNIPINIVLMAVDFSRLFQQKSDTSAMSLRVHCPTCENKRDIHLKLSNLTKLLKYIDTVQRVRCWLLTFMTRWTFSQQTWYTLTKFGLSDQCFLPTKIFTNWDLLLTIACSTLKTKILTNKRTQHLHVFYLHFESKLLYI